MQEDENTVLILGNEDASHANVVPVTEDDFTIVLHDTCNAHDIITSINGLRYRIEVLTNGVLEDAVEIECDELKMNYEAEALFKEIYTKAHKTYKEKYCSPMQDAEKNEQFVPFEVPLEHKEESQKYDHHQSLLQRLGHIYQNVKTYIKERGYNHRVVLVGVLLGAVAFFVIVGRILICSESVIDFFVKESDKVAYYEQTEALCHKLEHGCLKLSKMDLSQETLLSPEECRTWCKEKIISSEQCALFLPYFPQKEKEIVVDTIAKEKKKIEAPKAITQSYLFLPKTEIVLHPQKYFELFVQNHTETLLHVKLKNIILNESEHEEIVQFRQGVSKLTLEAKSKKRFQIFLEQSYYEQFDKGIYAGTFIFSVRLGKTNKEEIQKTFSFKVE